jgi:hypothetical protein
MEKSPCSELIVTQLAKKYPKFLCNPMFHNRVQKTPPMVLILSQMHPAHTFPPYFPKIHSNIIFSSRPRSSEWSLPFMFYVFLYGTYVSTHYVYIGRKDQ